MCPSYTRGVEEEGDVALLARACHRGPHKTLHQGGATSSQKVSDPQRHPFDVPFVSHTDTIDSGYWRKSAQ